MTMASVLIYEGLEKGRQEGLLEVARNMLRKGMFVATITEVTRL